MSKRPTLLEHPIQVQPGHLKLQCSPHHPGPIATTTSHGSTRKMPFDDLSKKMLRSADPKDCRDIIQGAHIKRLGLSNSLKDLEARAVPNQRLVKSFGINNCFTTTMQDRCHEFRSGVERLIHMEPEKWNQVADAIRAIVQYEFSKPEETQNLSDLTQMVVMKTSLHILFPSEFDFQDHNVDSAVCELAKQINQTWLLSKNEHSLSNFHASSQLKKALGVVLPLRASNDDPAQNPLNWILPGYETIWRVTLRCFVELNMRHHPHESEWHRVLDAFAANPTRDQLKERNAHGVSAMDVSKEALRLYPPTRRIYRTFQSAAGVEYETAADVESLHRNLIIWGVDAEMYRPERWAGLSGTQTKHFMPMGCKPFACPARQESFSGADAAKLPFGVSFLALLVGIMSDEKQKQGWQAYGSLPDKGGPLPTDREALGDLFVRRAAGRGGQKANGTKDPGPTG